MRCIKLTFIEILMIIVFLAIMASIIVTFHYNTFSDKVPVMKKYVKTLYPDIENVNVVTSNRDTDMDGYVRCTATGIYEGKTIRIEADCSGSECASVYNENNQ